MYKNKTDVEFLYKGIKMDWVMIKVGAGNDILALASAQFETKALCVAAAEFLRTSSSAKAQHPPLSQSAAFNASERKRPIYIARALPIPYRSHQSPNRDTSANKGGQGAASSPAAAARPLGALVSEIAKTIQPPEKRTDSLPVGS
jgi:hypothetical protein